MADPDTTDTSPEFLEVRIDVPEPMAELVGELVYEHGAQGMEIRDGDTLIPEGAEAPADGRAHVIAWLSVDTDREAFAALVAARLGEGADPKVTASVVEAEDWVAKIRAAIQPIRLGRRLFIRPSWSDEPARDGELELVLDPGLAFGTGSHPTTALCLVAVESELDAAREQGRAPSLLDVGTGTGILCILAARLGASRCVGLDVDQTAIEVAQENAEDLGVDDRCTFSTLPVAKQDGVWDLVTANIQLGVLTALAPDIAARVAPGGVLYLSGLLEDQAPIAAETYAKYDLTAAETTVDGGWARVKLTRPLG